MRAVEALRIQARSCAAMDSPMYAGLLDHLADDLAAGGPTARVLAGHDDDPGPSALGLRLLGSVHRLVLTREAGELAWSWPSVGGTWDPVAGGAAVVDLLDRAPDRVREWLDRPPQTNEVGRSAALVGALLQLPDELRLPVRLVELGASGGLQLLADRFRVGEHGDPGSPVRLDGAWRHRDLRAWPGLRFVEAWGCDPRPVDVGTTEGRLVLTAYVWPDQAARLERLRAALSLVDAPLDVRRCGAADLLADVAPQEGALTVVWHSVMWQYLAPAEQQEVTARLEALGAAASASAPVAHVALEPRRREPAGHHEFLVTLRTWPGTNARVLGVAAPHGVPVHWA